jgi:ATP synthase protein I
VQASTPQDPFRAMLRGGLLPALPVAAVALVVAVVVAGGRGAAGSLLATAVVTASFASSLLVMSRAARSSPELVMAVALLAYVTKIGLLGVFLLVFRTAGWLSGGAFTLTAVSVALVWLVGEVWAFTRVRTLVFDAPPPADKVTRS